MGEGAREEVYRMREIVSQFEVCEGGWKVVDSL